MSERGVFAMDRGWFDHPCFAPDPYTEREAWAWLIAAAAYRVHQTRVGSITTKLARGQLAASLRFMAEKWKWSEASVRRFIAKLKGEAMIVANSDAGITVITICNYNRYQRVSLPDDAKSDAVVTQKRRKEEDIEYKEVDGGGDARATPSKKPLVGEEAIKIAEAVAAIAGHPEPKHWPPGWCGAPMRVQAMLDQGWHGEIIIVTARGVMAKKRDGPAGSISYFEKAFAIAHAQQATPLPVVITPPAEQVYGRSSRNGAGKLNVHEAAHDLAERVRSLNEPAPRDLRDGAIGGPIRRISSG